MTKQKKLKEFLDDKGINYTIDDKGENYKIERCVFCGNQNSNLEVHATKGIFNCWACEESGSFTQFQEKVSESPARNAFSTQKHKSDFTAKALELHGGVSSSPVSQYLQMRGFSKVTTEHFKFGAEKIGSEWWLSIPHFKRGKAVNIKYRSAQPKPKKWRQETGAQKVLFNCDALEENDDIFLVEGELKAAALHQIGIANVVALTGGVSAIQEDWIRQLRRKRRVYLCLDSDDPGQAAAIGIAKRIGIEKCFNILLEDAKDPDEYFFERRHSKKDFIDLAKKAVTFDPSACFSGLRKASSIPTENVQYLWSPRIPLRKISLLEGNPGVGKSQLALAVAAAISRNEHPYPENEFFECNSSNVLIFCGEDGAGDTIVPRLRHLKADLENIQIYSGHITFDKSGLAEIEAMIGYQKPALVIFDPLTAFMGSRVDMNRANEVREQLSQVAQIAERHDCAVLIVRHLSKATKNDAIYRGLGSIDLAAVARSILLIGKHPTDASLRVIVHTKSNLSKESRTIQFKLENGEFSWAGMCDLTVDEILYPNKEAEQVRLEKAKEFLIREISFGAVNSTHLKQMAAAQGIPERTLERAKSFLGIKSRRVGTPGKKGSGYFEWFNENKDDSTEGIH